MKWRFRITLLWTKTIGGTGLSEATITPVSTQAVRRRSRPRRGSTSQYWSLRSQLLNLILESSRAQTVKRMNLRCTRGAQRCQRMRTQTTRARGRTWCRSRTSQATHLYEETRPSSISDRSRSHQRFCCQHAFWINLSPTTQLKVIRRLARFHLLLETWGPFLCLAVGWLHQQFRTDRSLRARIPLTSARIMSGKMSQSRCDLSVKAIRCKSTIAIHRLHLTCLRWVVTWMVCYLSQESP